MPEVFQGVLRRNVIFFYSIDKLIAYIQKNVFRVVNR